MGVQRKRIHDPVDAGDGYRVLVDGMWPRGISRDRARLDEWRRELAPSAQLRRWFGHRRERWPEFRRRYRDELAEQQPVLDELARRAAGETVTLLYAARDRAHNNAAVLEEVIAERLGRQPG